MKLNREKETKEKSRILLIYVVDDIKERERKSLSIFFVFVFSDFNLM